MATYANVDIVSPAEANDIILEEDPLVLDVRTPEEYAQGHIEGAVNLPLDSLNDATAAEVVGPYEAIVLLYCKSGTRSSIACGMLSEMGYEHIYDLAGGINAWPFGVVE